MTSQEDIERWDKDEQYQRIIDALEAIEPLKRSYQQTIDLARAYNNLAYSEDFEDAGALEQALSLLDSVEQEGSGDASWNFRTGYALHFLCKEDEAIPFLECALELYPETTEYETVREDAAKLLRWSQGASERKAHYRSRWENRTLPESAQESFKGFDFSGFWRESDWSLKSYTDEAPSDELILEVEQELGHKLPRSYVWLMKQHNGGTPNNTCFPSELPTSWAKDHVAIDGIMGISKVKNYGLCGSLGSRFMIEEWGYPSVGVAVCTCPSAGHDMIFLDYSGCGHEGEPAVVHIDQEDDYAVTYLADDFESFVRGLVNEETY